MSNRTTVYSAFLTLVLVVSKLYLSFLNNVDVFALDSLFNNNFASSGSFFKGKLTNKGKGIRIQFGESSNTRQSSDNFITSGFYLCCKVPKGHILTDNRKQSPFTSHYKIISS